MLILLWLFFCIFLCGLHFIFWLSVGAIVTIVVFILSFQPFKFPLFLLTAHCSLLTTHYSLLTAHSSLLTPHSPLLTPHSSLLFADCRHLQSTLPNYFQEDTGKYFITDCYYNKNGSIEVLLKIFFNTMKTVKMYWAANCKVIISFNWLFRSSSWCDFLEY